MGKPSGLVKSGGRSKGSLNKRTESFLEAIGEFNYDPLRSILKKYDSLSPGEQIKIDLKLIEYVYPKLKEQSLPISESEAQTSISDIFFKVFEISEKAKTDPDLAAKLNAIIGNLDPVDLLERYASLSAEFL